jgi:hypothetical protein
MTLELPVLVVLNGKGQFIFHINSVCGKHVESKLYIGLYCYIVGCRNEIVHVPGFKLIVLRIVKVVHFF